MKQVHWQLPFGSLDGEQYRIDIYDSLTPDPSPEGEGGADWPIQLVGAASPFETSENASDDFFEPVRSQTGTIRIVNTDGLLSIEDLLPQNDTDMPVEVHSGGAVVWRGYLVCDRYNQDYTARPHEIDLQCVSVLEAMDSVQVGLPSAGLTTIKKCIYDTMNAMSPEAKWIGVYYPYESHEILNKMIDRSVFYTMKEQANGNRSRYEAEGISLKEVLKNICQFMGWTLRESAGYLYFDHLCSTYGYYYESWSRMSGSTTNPERLVSLTNGIMEGTLTYKGTEHSFNVQPGAKSVEVVASIKDFIPSITLPDCPVSDTMYTKNWHLSDGKFVYMSCNPDENLHSNVNFLYPLIICCVYRDIINSYGSISMDFQDFYDNTLLSRGLESPRYLAIQNPSRSFEYIAGGCFAKGLLEDESLPQPEVVDGLYCSFFPGMLRSSVFAPSQTTPIAKIRSVLPTRVNEGYLRMDADYFGIYANTGSPVCSLETLINLAFSLRIGNKFWDSESNSWVESQKIFTAPLLGGAFQDNWSADMGIKKTDGYLIPVNSELNGEIELWIWPQAWNLGQGVESFGIRSLLNEVFFKALSIDYIPYDKFYNTDRNENHYYYKTGARFKDEKSIKTEFASVFGNNPSPSIIRNSENEAMSEMVYHGAGETTYKSRPEIDLLNRMALHYGSPKRVLELQVAHPGQVPLPTLRLRGYEDKQYTPLSESRNWRTNTSTLTCFEI